MSNKISRCTQKTSLVCIYKIIVRERIKATEKRENPGQNPGQIPVVANIRRIQDLTPVLITRRELVGKIASAYIARRNISTAFVAVGMFVLLMWALSQDSGKPVSKENIQSVVTEIKYNSRDKTIAYLLLELPDKKIIKMFINLKPAPKIGDSVPLIVEHYDNDKKYYGINHQRWFDDQYIR